MAGGWVSIRNFVSSKRHISYYAALLHVHVTVNRGGSRTFKTGGVGGGGPGAVELLDLRFALMPLHTHPMFLLEE